MQRCPYCGSTDLVVNHARGDTVCGNPACGELLEEKTMVAETSFVQRASGGFAAAGGRVSWSGLNYGAAGGQTNHELAVARGISKLSYIADRLQLSTQIQEAGRRMYQLAVQMNFNAGRPTRFIASACLYVVCRRNRSPHLLIDFSDVLQSPVRVLGQVYMRLVRRLVGADPAYPQSMGEGIIEVPIVDPSIFIERFARRLQFGGMQRKVQNTAMRLIQFMHREWICLGRRPNGLCGAALLIAAYYHGFKCSAKDVSEVVRMKEGTLRVRLCELQQTPLALMSREEFERADLEAVDNKHRPLPPCLKARRRREEFAALLDAEQGAIQDAGRSEGKDRERPALQDTAQADRRAMPPPLPPARPGAKRQKVSAASQEDGTSPSTAHAPIASGSDSSTAGALVPADLAKAAKYTVREPSSNDIEDIARDIASQHHIEEIIEGSGPGSPGWEAAAARVKSLVAGKPEFDGLPLAQRSGADEGKEAASEAGSLLSEELQEPAASQEETLSDVDDEELELYLLDEEEQQHKSDIWHEVNKDYLEEWHVRGQEARRKKQDHKHASTSEAADSASDTGSASRSRRMFRYPPAGSCTQSAMMALAKKGKVKPNRINIEALESLFS